MIAGIVDHETGTRDIRKLGGLMSVMPISFTVAFIGSMSMAGLPPFGGFLSKELFLTSIVALTEFDLFHFDTWGMMFPIIAWIASVFTFVYSFYFVFRTFAGKRPNDLLPVEPKEPPIGMLISPIVLAIFVVTIFFIPNLVGDALVKPAVVAMQAGLYTDPSEILVHVSAWHGFTTEMMMTLAVVVVGAILYATLSKWQKFYSLQPESFSLNALYQSLMVFAEKTMNNVSRLYMTGVLRTYLIYIFVAIVIVMLTTMFVKDGFKVDIENSTPLNVYGILAAIILVISIWIAVTAKKRMTALIAIGAIGYSVAMFFVIFKAPDLALTQLVIKTVSVALFLLAFYHLPKLNLHGESKKFRLGNFIVALGVGATMTLLAISAHSHKLIPSISQYYKDTVVTEAGGGNIVNVILVDYRGFDTLFEIAVLAIAGIGVYVMIRLQLTRKGKADEN